MNRPRTSYPFLLTMLKADILFVRTLGVDGQEHKIK